MKAMRRVLICMLIAALSCALCAGAEESGAYAAYAQVLRDHEVVIRSYWQGGGAWGDAGYMPTAEPRAIALADLVGDETPELVFVGREGGFDGYTATLYVYGFQGGAAVELARVENWDSWGGSSGVTCLYQVAGSRDLYGVTAGNYDGYHHLSSPDGMALQVDSVVRMYDEETATTTQNGAVVEDSIFDERAASFPRAAATLLLYSVYDDPSAGEVWDGWEAIDDPGMESIAMTYDEALTALEGGAVAPAPAAPAAPVAPGGTAQDAQDAGILEGVFAMPAAPAESAQAPAGSPAQPQGGTGLELLGDALEVELIHFDDAQDSVSVQFHADGSFSLQAAAITGMGDGSMNLYTGTIDRAEPRGARSFSLHVASLHLEGSETYGQATDWESLPFREGDTLVLVLPGAGEGELDGPINPTMEQLELYGEAVYDGACYYIGVPDESGEIWYQPFDVAAY